ncbi:MAG TPA: DUF6801 domain-containing protein [Nocardioidaceae bacterium]|nr:DUF6801 domain-containing protein [Nocardioidaceae bacterium]
MQSVSKSTRRRVSGGVAAACAMALTGGAMATGPVNAATPDDGADRVAPRKAMIKKNGIPYRCKATKKIVNDAIGGPQRFLVNVRVPIAGKFKGGTVVRVGKVHVDLVMPKRLVKKVRRDLGVKRVRGSAPNVRFQIRSKPGKNFVRKIKGLRSGWKKLPANRRLRIPTAGKTANFRIPKRAKREQVWAPKAFRIRAHLNPPAVGIVPKTALVCKAMGKPRKRFVGAMKVR